MTERLTVYDFVPKASSKDFDKWTQLDHEPVFVRTGTPLAGMVNVQYGDATYATRVDHFVWFFLGFYLTDSHNAVRLGGTLLEYMGAQVTSETIREMLKAIDDAPPGPSIVLGDYRANGFRIDAFKDAPGLDRQPSALGADYVQLVARRDGDGRVDALTKWLAKKLADAVGAMTKGGSNAPVS